MDEREVLALIYDEHRQALIDKTANINKISPSLYKNCVDISYYGSNRKYTTKNSNCRIYRRARIIDIANKDVYYAGRLLRGLNDLIDFGPYLKGLYNESSELYSKDSIKIIAKRDIRANELIKYISELTEVIRPNIDSDDGVRRALENGIDSLAELKESSFLYHMLYKKIEYKEAKKSGLIYPFMANCSQRLAVGIAINC